MQWSKIIIDSGSLGSEREREEREERERERGREREREGAKEKQSVKISRVYWLISPHIPASQLSTRPSCSELKFSHEDLS